MAAGTLKRVLAPEPGVPGRSLERIVSFVEIKTVWHPGADLIPEQGMNRR